jgi:DNA polymerase III subunit delta'
MIFPTYFDSKKSLNLYGLTKDFNFLKNLYINKKLPKVLMLTGKKGSGKATLINHLMFFIFDQKNYDDKINKLKKNTNFYNQFSNNIFENIIYLSGSDFKNIKVEDIRNLKKKIYQTSISNKSRFIILDDVELFNHNSLNALLKSIEEPTKNNYFLLINNKTKPLLNTIKSRSLEIKIILDKKETDQIIELLIRNFNLNLKLDKDYLNISPGYFLKFNFICENNNISLNDDFLKNLSVILNLYKKNKDVMYVDFILFLADCYFNKLRVNNVISSKKIIEYKSFVFENINKFFLYNLNQNALLNAIDNKIINE